MAKKVYIQDIELTGGSGGEVAWDDITDKPTFADVASSGDYADLDNKPDLDAKQDTLVSGTNIKTVNNESLLGPGNIDITGGGDFYVIEFGRTTYSEARDLMIGDVRKPILFNLTGTYPAVINIAFDTPAPGEDPDIIIDTHTVATDNNVSTERFVLKPDDTWDGNIIEFEGGVDFKIIEYGVTPHADIVADKPFLFKNASNYFVPITGVGGDESGSYIFYRNMFVLHNGDKSSLVYQTATVDVNDNWTETSFILPLQDTLVSGENIKTINNESLLGAGNIDIPLGDLTELTTEDQSNLVAALNEVYEKCGEPFRVKQWQSNTLNAEIPCCTEDISNTSIPKLTFTIDAEEGALYQIVGMIAYEVFDAESGGNRINCWPVCQFTGNGQKELGVRFMCAGTSRKTAKRISAWVLLKRRA